MDELTRSRYLQALGTDSYISRGQLPGAAATRRLAIVQPLSQASPQDVPALTESVASASAVPLEMPRLVADPVVAAPEAAPSHQLAQKHSDPKFSLVAIHCGGWLWLEEQGDAGLLPEQLLLVQSMALALGMIKGDADKRTSSARFDWPIHKNRQLDQGEDAARSSVAGFIQRKLEQLCCQGLVLLGTECEGRLALDQLDCARLARTVSTADMLRNPLLKRQAWRDLHPVSQKT